jgi:serine/threonine protein kinase
MANKRAIWRRVYLLGRYEKRRLLHKSATSHVWEVDDKECNDDHARVLALKEFQDEVHYVRESTVHAQHKLSEQFVVQILRRHPAHLSVLMPCGECSLEEAMLKEHFVGLAADYIRLTVTQLVQALMHVHQNGVVHGDVKGKNICRVGSTWKLIDFDSSAEIGGIVGTKIEPGRCPSNAPPELGRRLLRAKIPTRAVRSFLGDGYAPSSISRLVARGTWEECLPILDRLDREGLDPLVCTLGDAAPSFDIWALGLILFRLFSASGLFNSDGDEELDVEELCKLVLWRGLSLVELRRKVFSKADPGTVPNSEKEAAVDLIIACLRGDPKRRPQSIEELLQKEYFRARGASKIKAKLLFVSTPGKGLNRSTGKYDFEVMGVLQKLCRHFAGRFVVAYDWAGSSSADSRDQQWFDRIFTVRNSIGRTLFDEWSLAPTEKEKEIIIDIVQEMLYETRWFAAYKGSIKAQIRETCQAGAKAILVRFEGGPITRVEARTMDQLISEATADLLQLGVQAPVIELHAYDTIFDFADMALDNILGEIHAGEPYEPIPSALLAELHAGSTEETSLPHVDVNWVVGTRVCHDVRGPGRVLKVDWEDPQDQPVCVLFDESGEVHYYSLESARKLHPVHDAEANVDTNAEADANVDTNRTDGQEDSESQPLQVLFALQLGRVAVCARSGCVVRA